MSQTNAKIPASLSPWTVEIWEDENGSSPFLRSYSKLDEYDQAVVDAVIEKFVVLQGMDLVGSEWAKPLGGGLYELRIRRDLSTLLNLNLPTDQERIKPPWADRKVLLRIFCTFHGNKIVLLFQVYNKGKNPSERKQQAEIDKAREHLNKFQQESRRG